MRSSEADISDRARKVYPAPFVDYLIYLFAARVGAK